MTAKHVKMHSQFQTDDRVRVQGGHSKNLHNTSSSRTLNHHVAIFERAALRRYNIWALGRPRELLTKIRPDPR